MNTEKSSDTSTKHNRISRGRYEQLFTIVAICGSILFIIGAISFFYTMYRYSKEDSKYESATDKYVSTNITKPTSSDSGDNTTAETSVPEIEMQEWYELAEVDIDKLFQDNPNVIGWLFFEDESICYPITYNGDNDYYLDHAYDGTYAKSGSIFLDMKNSTDFDDPYSILYGHNMKDGSMFSPLKNYKSQEYRDDNPYFQIITSSYKYRYKIVSSNIVSMYSDYYSIPNSRDNILDNKLNEITSHGYIKNDIHVNSDDNVICLSTCSSKDNRLFVVGVRTDRYSLK